MSELNIEKTDQLQKYLVEKGYLEAKQYANIKILHGGLSSRIVQVELPSGLSWVIKQPLSKLRVDFDWFCSPERVHNEALAIKWLSELSPAGTIPALIFKDFSNHLLVMNTVPEPHYTWQTLLLAGVINHDHIIQFAKIIAAIHKNSFELSNNLSKLFYDRGFFESLVLEPSYSYTADKVPAAAKFINDLINETKNLRLSLVHGDYCPENILIHKDRLILVDQEVVHWGDPAFDIGFSLANFLNKDLALNNNREDLIEGIKLYWKVYSSNLIDIFPASFEARAVKHTLACLLAKTISRFKLDFSTGEEKVLQMDKILMMIDRRVCTISDLLLNLNYD